ncbi:MAG: hypothetical protein DRJ05_08515 [Bacteroidetes bacterium]|nr:MAG: hypothetical protein DRJ05_08515 [Bacteroidota bacterium]
MVAVRVVGRCKTCWAEAQLVGRGPDRFKKKKTESSFQPVGLPALNACYNPKVYSWQKTHPRQRPFHRTPSHRGEVACARSPSQI